jgi:predicted RNase H-like HicB family nuclease
LVYLRAEAFWRAIRRVNGVIMILKARTWPTEGYWIIECKGLGIVTQGFTRHDAFHMLVDAIESLIDKTETSINFIEGIGGEGLIYIPAELEEIVLKVCNKSNSPEEE